MARWRWQLIARQTRGVSGVTSIILAVLILIIVVVSSVIFFVLAEKKSRVVSSVSVDSADQFLVEFLETTYDTGTGYAVSGFALVGFTKEGLDPGYLRAAMEKSLQMVCQNQCYAEFSIEGERVTVGSGKLPKKISAATQVPYTTEVDFYVLE